MDYNNCLIDLHLHIDGALTIDIVKTLSRMQGTKLPTDDDATLFHLLTAPHDCKDLNDYLKCFSLPCSLMLTRETISEAIYLLQENLKSNGLIYAELRFAPQLHTSLGLSQEDVVKAAISGLNRSDFRANLILCCMRGDNNLFENMETVRLANVYRNQGVVAVDLAGAEGLYPTSDFEKVFRYAKELNLNFTIHAGEASGSESVVKALEFGASRIGHGVHSITDNELLHKLAKKQIPLELCITSNLQTKAVDSLQNYPLRTLMKHGVPITLNTDNPTVSNTTMRQEFELAKATFSLTNTEIKQLLLNSAKHSFANESLKTELVKTINVAFS